LVDGDIIDHSYSLEFGRVVDVNLAREVDSSFEGFIRLLLEWFFLVLIRTHNAVIVA
jgi:hypothetical protein